MMSNSEPRLVEVYRAKSLPEAHAIRLRLGDFGVMAVIDGEILVGLAGELPHGWWTAPRIKVEESQAAAAQVIIQHSELSFVEGDPHQFDEDWCLSCGVEMAENIEVCSSCGWSYLEDHVAESN